MVKNAKNVKIYDLDDEMIEILNFVKKHELKIESKDDLTTIKELCLEDKKYKLKKLIEFKKSQKIKNRINKDESNENKKRQ